MFIFVVIICLITGNFNNLFYFTISIFIHELGHIIIAIIFNYKLNYIMIYPYGANTSLTYLVNTNIYKELLTVLFGPLFEIIFVFFVFKFKLITSNNFYYINYYILLFNLLPIYPLDGGKIFNLLLSINISFYKSLKITYYLSYLLINILIIINIIYIKNLIILIVLITLLINVLKEKNNIKVLYNKFILERYLYNIRYKKVIFINNIYSMYRNKYHYINYNNIYIDEKKYLEYISSFNKICYNIK